LNGKSGHLIRSCPNKNAAGGSIDSVLTKDTRPNVTVKLAEVGIAGCG